MRSVSHREDGYGAHKGNGRLEATVEGKDENNQGNDADARTDMSWSLPEGTCANCAPVIASVQRVVAHVLEICSLCPEKTP